MEEITVPTLKIGTIYNQRSAKKRREQSPERDAVIREDKKKKDREKIKIKRAAKRAAKLAAESASDLVPEPPILATVPVVPVATDISPGDVANPNLVILAGNSFQAVFSDPSGIGGTLPLSVANMLVTKKKQQDSKKRTSNKKKSSVARDTRYNHMRVFVPGPPTQGTPMCIMLFLIAQLGAFMAPDDIGERVFGGQFGVVKTDTSDTSGIRMINGNRIEIFLKDKDRVPASIIIFITSMLKELCKLDEKKLITIGPFDAITVQLCLIAYCDHAAMADERISKAEPAFIFQNHAIIATWGFVEPQDIHIDLDLSDQYQFGILMSDKSQPTSEYKASLPVLGPNKSLCKIWADMPADLDKKLRNNQDIQDELNSYGQLLSEPVKVGQSQGGNTTDRFPVGTLISLPSKIPHGGPEVVKGFRAVLFFTGCEPGALPYNSDKQANRTTIVGNMLSLGWPTLTTHTDRMYLLRKWLNEGLRKDRHAVANIHHGPLKKLGQLLQKIHLEDQEILQDEELLQDPEQAQHVHEFLENQLEEEMERFANYDWDPTAWKKGKKQLRRVSHSRTRHTNM